MPGDFGSNVCPAGAAGIGTEVACQAGVATLGFVYVRSLSNSAFPKGCYSNGTHAWLNTHATGSASATRQRICASASAATGPATWCNDTMFLDGAGGSQSSKMGYYYLVEGLVQGGRPVYKYDSAAITVYLFYWASSGRWHFGADYTSSTASLRASSSAACPDAATGWQVGTNLGSNSVWTSADSLVVTAGRSEDCPARWSCSLAPTNLVAVETNNEKGLGRIIRSVADRTVHASCRRHLHPLQDPVPDDAHAATGPVCSAHSAGTCSRSIVVWGGVTPVEEAAAGNYEQVSGLTRGGRPVYRLEGNASKFLFFLRICSDWAIGEVLPTASQDAAPVSSTFCALFKSSLRSDASPTACPHQAASWNFNGGDGYYTSSYSVAVFAPGAPVAAACSEFIHVRGAEAEQLSSMGRYYVVPRMTLGGRPVYARDYYNAARPGRFLFYSPNTANWYIGPSWGSYASAVLRSTGASAAGCPDEASGWEVSLNGALFVIGSGAWASSVGITVAAPAGMTSAGEDRSPPARDHRLLGRVQ